MHFSSKRPDYNQITYVIVAGRSLHVVTLPYGIIAEAKSRNVVCVDMHGFCKQILCFMEIFLYQFGHRLKSGFMRQRFDLAGLQNAAHVRVAIGAFDK